MLHHNRLRDFLSILFVAVPSVHAQITPGELVSPKMEFSGGNLNFTVQPSVLGRSYQLQYSDTLAGGAWTDVETPQTGNGGNLVISTPYAPGVPRRFYRLALVETSVVPEGFVLIPAGSFQMGDQSMVGDSNELPVHSVFVSAFHIAKYEVTKALWDEVRTWGRTHGYTDLLAGRSKGATYPISGLTWFDMVKWCNARTEFENATKGTDLTPCYAVPPWGIFRYGSTPLVTCDWNATGYRLPTEAEWEKAARGGLSGQNFPWGNTISHTQANYYSSSLYIYDVSRTRGYHPTYQLLEWPYNSPVGSFAANEYGLYDMAGGVLEWCWDRFGAYSPESQIDPHGPDSGDSRVLRGGSWHDQAFLCRVASRSYNYLDGANGANGIFGFRLAQRQR